MRPEDSGNASLAARELPPDTADAMNRLLTRRARQLRKAGIRGTLDELRIQAFLERFGHPGPLGNGGADGSGGNEGNGGRGPKPGGAGPAGTAGTGTGGTGAGFGSWAGGCCPACGSTGSRINLTVPLATLTGVAGKPGHLRGTGPVDPKPEANTSNRYEPVA